MVSGEKFGKKLTLLHLGDKLLVKQTTGLLVKRAVDGNNIRLRQQLLKGINTTAANLLLDLRRQGLVIVVEKFFAVKGLETTEHTLTDTADSNGTDDLVLEIVLVLGYSSDVPVTASHLLVGWDKVADKHQDGHDDVLGDGDDIGASHFGDGDTTIGSVCSV